MAKRTVLVDRLANFVAIYREELPKLMAQYPADYGLPPESDFAFQAQKTADNMAKGFADGMYNYQGRAIASTCKRLGIKHTRTSIEAYLAGN